MWYMLFLNRFTAAPKKRREDLLFVQSTLTLISASTRYRCRQRMLWGIRPSIRALCLWSRRNAADWERTYCMTKRDRPNRSLGSKGPSRKIPVESYVWFFNFESWNPKGRSRKIPVESYVWFLKNLSLGSQMAINKKTKNDKNSSFLIV